MGEKATLLQILKDKDFKSLSIEIIDNGIDFVKDAGDFDIPFVSTGLKIISLPTKISGYFFAKKIRRFIEEVKMIDDDKRVSFVIKMEDDELYSKVGETTLVILDKLERKEKATLLGKLFKVYIEQKIDKDAYLRMSIMIERAFLEDLEMFGTNELGILGIDNQAKINLHIVGLLNQELEDRIKYNEYLERITDSKHYLPPKFTYELNSYGKMIREFCYENLK